ncbi:MAG: chloride channel protein, partial [Collinsella intestinalis]|nr:chloride channel protein [Collinsella intestinalis]
RFFARYIKKPYLRIFVGGTLVVLLTVLCGVHSYNGAGMDVIERAISGDAVPEAFVLKAIFTAITLGCGFKGGEIVPAFFIGATFGCFYGAFLGIPAGFAGAMGMTAVFCGVTNCPLTSILLSYELFGGAGLPLFALCIAVSYMLSGYRGLYSEQKIMYSKYSAEFVGRRSGD